MTKWWVSVSPYVLGSVFEETKQCSVPSRPSDIEHELMQQESCKTFASIIFDALQCIFAMDSA